MACRLEELPDPGDFVEYEITDGSILLVGQEDGSIKAFHKACPRRGGGKGSGRIPKGQIACPSTAGGTVGPVELYDQPAPFGATASQPVRGGLAQAPRRSRSALACSTARRIADG